MPEAAGGGTNAGGRSGWGATVFREGLPPQPASQWVATLDELEVIAEWLRMFRARLRMARYAGLETGGLIDVTTRLEARLTRRRSELA